MNPPAHGGKPAPRIASIWRDRITSSKADEYAAYLYEHGIRPLDEKARAVMLLRDYRAGEREFVTISYWESVEAMGRFAGKDPWRIHHLEGDAEFLIELPHTVQCSTLRCRKACSPDRRAAPPAQAHSHPPPPSHGGCMTP